MLLVLLHAPVAQAHVFLTRSDPASGATVASLTAVRLWFSADIASANARLVDSSGRVVDGTRVVPSSDPRLLVLTVPRLATGTYGVPWQVRDGGHPVSGTLVFTVGSAVAAPALGAGWRWIWPLLLAGLVVLAAALSMLFGGTARARPRVVVAVVGTLTLVGVAPLAVGGPGPAAPGRAVTRTGTAADLVVTITATPNRPGANGFTVTAASARRPPPAPVDGVRLEFTANGRRTVVVLRRIGAERYFASTEVHAPGPTRIDAVLERAGDVVTVPVSWQLDMP